MTIRLSGRKVRPGRSLRGRAVLTAKESPGTTYNVRVSTAALLEQIGSTEAGHAFCANGIGANTPGTLGRPVPGWEVQVRDAQGFPADGEQGHALAMRMFERVKHYCDMADWDVDLVADDNLQCGGVNVSFSGVYRR